MTNLFFLRLLLIWAALLQYCSTKDTYCHEPIPGVSKLLYGVDITELDLFPLEESGIGGMKRPVIKKTCHSDRFRTINGINYQIPNQVAGFVSTPGGSKSVWVEVYKSYEQVRSKMSLAVGLKGELASGKFSFSLSSSYSTMQKSMLQSNKRVMDVSSKEYSHNIFMKKPGNDGFLLESFQQTIDDLKGKTFKADRNIFQTFIYEYGTHYFQWGSFGGMIRQHMETSDSYAADKTDEELSVQAQAAYKGFFNKVSGSAAFDLSKTKVNSKFESSTKQTIKYYGGEADLLTPNGLAYWQETVDKDPALLRARIAPLYELVTNSSTMYELKTATNQHIMRNFLKELDRKLKIVKLKYHAHEVDVIEVEARLKTFHEADMLDEDKVAALNADIVYQTEVPRWFTQNTQLCFRYRAKTNGNNQCNGLEGTYPESVCAVPNRYTQTYHDNSGGVSGAKLGCLLEWGISSSLADEWFQETQICNNWFTNVFSIDKEGEDCAPVNEFTKIFHDDSFEKRGKNNYQWKITIPDKAPLWFRRTKLCFEWSATHLQCWAGAKKMCATPGAYTDVFTDNTNYHYKTGCNLKWAWIIDN